MEKFKFWYLVNQTKITWFLTGWLSLSFLNSLAHGDYVNAAISGGIIWLNLVVNK